ncbi:hypothetical protein Taro_005603 [Colocasia esculenta]|uniref:Uncharacterized protein n=1 Tax=Colocasia esculenta TaxID=4460 RepID=A0A843TYC6_COLES|nr:hypothetical protein [Colocasia esculenta]
MKDLIVLGGYLFGCERGLHRLNAHVGQTFLAKVVSTHPLLVSTQCFKAKAECCRNGEVVSTLDQVRYKYSPNWPSNHKRASKSLPEILLAAERALLPVPTPLVLLHPNSHIFKHKKRSLIQDEAV